jgi:hypothetical protein
MNILIDIGHPAHAYLFRFFSLRMIEKGHSVIFSVRSRDNIIELTKNLKLNFSPRPRGFDSVFLKPFSFLIIIISLIRQCKKNNINLIIGGTGNAYVPFAARLLSITSVIFDDTEHDVSQLALIKLAAHKIVTPSCYTKDLGLKHIRYRGYHELAYLHPRYFKPDSSVLDLLNVGKDTRYVIMRFVSWSAAHDLGHSGLTLEVKRRAIKDFSKYAKVFITSETPLSKEFERYRITIPPDRIHDALYFASLYVGEGGTMASESAVLGTPAIYVNSLNLGYIDEEEKEYGLVYSIANGSRVIDKGLELLKVHNVSLWEKKKTKLLSDKIDVTSFMVDLIEDLPIN